MGLLNHLRQQLIVSCQASPGSPFRRTDFICAFAQAATASGARALRIESLEDVRAVRAQESVPIIGLIKHPSREVFITPDLKDIHALAEAGADVIAFDATARPRPFPVGDMVAACHDLGKLAMADISTAEEGLAASEAGADLVGTTLSGYTPYSRPGTGGPDLELIRVLAGQGVPTIAEGNIRTPLHARQALKSGAFAVVVGSAITRPEDVTRWFLEEMREFAGT